MTLTSWLLPGRMLYHSERKTCTHGGPEPENRSLNSGFNGGGFKTLTSF